MKPLKEYTVKELQDEIDSRRSIQKDPDEPYKEERWCEHCFDEQIHNCKDSGHERDSSRDYEECTVCGYHRHGMCGKQQPGSVWGLLYGSL